MVDDRLRFPAPGAPRGAAPVQLPPPRPDAPRIIISFQPPPPPIVTVVANNINLRSTQPYDSDIFHWPRAGPLGVRVNNGTDVEVRAQVHVADEQTTSQPLVRPVLEFDVAATRNEHRSVDPGSGDIWGPWAWIRLTPLAAPTQGAIRASLARLGDL